eukprot:TRINITY_DN449_c7_g1_i1.p1 TRINITY_DN449_c7_g1~~TRINITY_DN449_c7_g1_i1.p1  ORF type:complete len:1271 (+),score=197.17 TRINITY_DN449_c7_g1_i1:109-3921(+)
MFLTKSLFIASLLIAVQCQDIIVNVTASAQSGLKEVYLREGHLGSGVRIMMEIPGDQFDIESVRRALPTIFVPRDKPCNGRTYCDIGFKSRMKNLLDASPAGSNVNCVCDSSCGTGFPAALCTCSADRTSCQKFAVTFLLDPLYDISSEEIIDIALHPGLLKSIPWGAVIKASSPLSIQPSPAKLSITTSGSSEPRSSASTSGSEFASGQFTISLVLTGDTWKKSDKLTLTILASNIASNLQPNGFESRRDSLLPGVATLYPPNTLSFVVNKDIDYRLLPSTTVEVLTICNDLNACSQLVTSEIAVLNNVSLSVGDPFPAGSTCDHPLRADCSNCVDGYFGINCNPCPGGDGNVCSGNGECLSGNCYAGCTDGFTGAGLCNCLSGWEGPSCDSMKPMAIAGTATTSVAAGSLFLEIAAGGSPAAPITTVTQLQLVVLLGVQVCSPSQIRELSSSVTWIVNPFYGDITTEHPASEHASHLLHSYIILGGSFVAHAVVIVIVFLIMRRKGWTLLDAQEVVWFPNLQFIVIFLTLFNSVSSASAIVSTMEPNHPAAIIGSIAMLLFYGIVLPALIFRYVRKTITKPKTPSKVRAQYISRNVANTNNNALRIVYTSKRAAKMPSALCYFLNMGFWTSWHLPDRGFCHRCGLLFDEFHEEYATFLGIQALKFVVYSVILGVQTTSFDNCRIKMWVMLAVVLLFACVITHAQPYSSRGSNMLHSLIAWCNAGVLGSIITDLYGGGKSKAHAFLVLNSVLLIICALWNVLVFILGRTVYRVKHVAYAEESSGLTRDAERAHFSINESNIKDFDSEVTIQASHCGQLMLKVGNKEKQEVWCELRGGYFFYFNKDDTATPVGGIILKFVRVQFDQKKNRIVLEDLSSDKPIYLSIPPSSEAGGSDLESWLKALQQSASKASGVVAEGPRFSKKPLSMYIEICVLGEGAYGRVTKVQDRQTGTCYALKQITYTSEDKERILNEVSIMQIIQHPYIVRLEEAIQGEGSMFLVMTLLTGGDLGQHLKEKGSFTVPQTKFYMAQTLLALEHLHANNILYRDLKPSNIVLDAVDRGNAVLTDMGIATVGLTSSTFCGTPYYLAPEVVKYNSYNQAVDYWTFGVVIFELLTNTTPFAAMDQQTTFQLIEMRNPHYPANFPPAAKELVSKLLQKKPDVRLTNPKKIKKAKFFKGIDFEKLKHGSLTPPKIAPLQEDPELETRENPILHNPLLNLSPIGGEQLPESTGSSQRFTTILNGDRVPSSDQPFDILSNRSRSVTATLSIPV